MVLYIARTMGKSVKLLSPRLSWVKRLAGCGWPGRDSVVRVPMSRLFPLKDSWTGTADGIAYIAAAARVADALTQDMQTYPSKT